MARRSSLTSLMSLALVSALFACSPGGDAGTVGSDVAATSEQDHGAPTVDIVDSELRLVDADGIARTVAVLDPVEDGRLVHATLRPGERPSTTVLALTRAVDADGPRYELRYLVVTDEEVTDLYWFPWRLQVDDELVGVLDEPPLPIWAPDGSSVAWVEWDGAGTRLRTVAWRDDGESSNPSDDASSYPLEGVPAGTQLAAWELGGDGVPVLRGTHGDTIWHIRLDVGNRAIAMPEGG